MKKRSTSHSGFFQPRVFLGFALCFAGASLAVVSLAGPYISIGVTPAAGAPPPDSLKPTVFKSVLNGVSGSVRDLPAKPPTVRDFEHELPPVKPAREVPADFVDQAVQKVLGPTAMATPIVSFDGLNQEEACGGCIPPDPTGAVGPTQYVQMANSAFSVYAKNGTRLSGPTPINQLFQSFPPGNVCRDTNNGDPVVVYDQLADRWLLSQFAFPFDANNNPIKPWDECIAISQGPDATGPYYIYDFHLSDTKFHDYPHIGLWPDAYYMATHEFLAPDFNYAGAAAIAFERDKMLKGQPAQLVIFDLGNLPAPFNTAYGGHLPSNLDGFNLPPAGAPNYFVEVDSATELPPAAALRIWKFHVDWVSPANSTFGIASQPNSTLTVANFARPPCSLAGERVYISGCVPQLGDPSQLDPIGDRLMYRLVYRNFGDHESLVLNHTVVADATTGQMGPRWYEVRDPGGLPAIAQQSTFAPSGPTDLYRFVGSIAMDRLGNMAIGYSTSSATSFPSIAYSGRLTSDPVNTLAQGETVLIAGGGPQHGEAFAPQTGRWGDYTTLTVDPVDDCTFWYTDEYYGNPAGPTANWQTRVGSFKFSQCTPRPTGLLTGVVTESGSGIPISGAKIRVVGGAIDYTAISTPSGVYQFSPLPPGTYSVTASAIGYFSSSSVTVTITDGGTTVQNFALTRNLAEPTPPPTPLPDPLQNVNPPALNDPGATITTNNYSVSWSAAENTTNLDHYVVEESTDYVSVLFDNAEGAQPGDAASPWASESGGLPAMWVKNTEYFHSPVTSYFTTGPTDGFDTSLTLKAAITIPGTVGSARLNFWSRFYNDPEDTGNIEISKDGGTTWDPLRVLIDGPQTPPADTRMQDQEIDLTPDKAVPIKLRFRFNTDPVTYFLIRTLGWWIDDILVDGATWTQVGTTPANTTAFNITNKPNGHYYYRVRAVYTNGHFTANSNVQDIIVNAPGASPTATPTATATVAPSATATASPAASATATASPTATSTAAASPSATATATASPTPTATATASSTVTPAATASPSATATATATASATAIATASPSATATATASPSATATATASPGATATATASPTATATATASPSASPTATATATPTGSPSPAQLLNISTRSDVQTGDHIAIAGFIIKGTGSGNVLKTILVRAQGPSVSSNGNPVPGRLTDTTLELRNQAGGLIRFNDDWKESQRTEIEQTGLAPKDDKESAIVQSLPEGTYTAVLRGKNSTGIGLVEVFDVSNNSEPHLANISTRSLVETGDKVMIGGLIAGPSNRGNTPVVIRALGPSLTSRGVADALPNPTLELHDQNGTIIAVNDDWQTDANASQVQSVGLAPDDPKESALYRVLGPTAYTAVVRDAGGATGIGLVEVYNLP
jgi:carboxypeptidase family protein